MVHEKARLLFEGGFYDLFLQHVDKKDEQHPFQVIGTPTVVFSHRERDKNIEYFAVNRSFSSKEEAFNYYEAVRTSFPPPVLVKQAPSFTKD